MLLQFTVVKDNTIWVADTKQMMWARVSASHTDPESKVLESGKLIPQGFGVYLFDGRVNPPGSDKPNTKVEGPTSIGVSVIGFGDTAIVAIRPDVEIKDFTMPVPIRQVLYKIMPTDPKQIETVLTEAFDGKSEPSDRTADPAGDLNGDTSGDSGQPSPQAA